MLASKRSDFTAEMFRFYASTPMIIIDGPRGPVPTGDLPIYEVPALLLGLLGHHEPTIMDYTRAPAGMRVRPLPGLHFDLLDDGRVEVCKEPPFTPACERSSRWLRDVLTVNDDLFVGGQHTRR
ncbi:MAG: hypothetical protein PHF72_15500 [Gammaproteobacteria bacterium]|nr:hypothetical protein [Gammaproteobacteria bacterium]